eukprot:Colp12_sorted_trinity150504_noHs@1963
MCCSLVCCCGAFICCGKTSVATRAVYAFFFLLATVLAWIMRSQFFADWIQSGPLNYSCANNDQCYGILSVYRICIALCIYHGTLCLVMIGVKNTQDPRAVLHNGLWPIKFIALVGITVGCFFIKGEDVIKFSIPALIGALIFLCFQLILLVDFAHTMTEKILNYIEYGDSKCLKTSCMIFLPTASLILWGGSFALTVILYLNFMPGNSECRINTFYITFNWLLALVYTLLSFSPRVQEKNPRSGVLQASMVFAYNSYLLFSALSSQPNDANFSCNRLTNVEDTQKAVIIVGVIFTFIAVIYSALSTSHSEDALNPSGKSGVLTDDTDDEESGDCTYNYSFFHLLFVLAAMYVAMLLTGWNEIDGTATTGYVIDQGFTSVWVKIVSSWVAALLYIWTLIAPIMFPDREFSFAQA